MSTENQDTSGLSPEKLALLNPELDLPPTFDDLVTNLEDSESVVEEPVEESTEVVEESPAPTESPEDTSTPPTGQFTVSRELLEIEAAKRELATQQKEFAARQKALEESMNSLAPFQRALELREAGDRLGAMDALGLKYEEVTEDYISGKGPDPVKQAKLEIEKMRQEYDRKFAELKQAEQEKTEAADRDYTVNFARANADDYPHVVESGGEALIYQARQNHLNSTGQVLSHADAAAAVEEGLEKLVMRVVQSERLRAKYAPLFKSTSSPKSRVETKTEDTSSTLSNNDSRERTVLVDDNFDFVNASDDELIERLAPQLQFDE